jgi:hypothetical protein
MMSAGRRLDSDKCQDEFDETAAHVVPIVLFGEHFKQRRES